MVLKVWFDVKFSNVLKRTIETRRIDFNLFDDVVPKTARNFYELCTGQNGFGYKDSTFHSIMPQLFIHGGDFQRHNGTGGKSIYGTTFEDENFDLKHDKPGKLTMASRGPKTNGSQFYITIVPIPSFDGKRVVFGEVADEKSFDVIRDLRNLGTPTGKLQYEPWSPPRIVDCGAY